MMATGLARAIMRAHNTVRPSQMVMSNAFLFSANINRSPTSYLGTFGIIFQVNSTKLILANPKSERNYYGAQGDTDKGITLLRILETINGTSRDRASINWYLICNFRFAVHGTSFNDTNKLVSGDNKGYAGNLMEWYMNRHRYPKGYEAPISNSVQNDRETGTAYVAAFSQSNEVFECFI